MTILHRNTEPAIRFRKSLDSAPDAMVVVDQHRRIAFVNLLATRLFEYASDDLLGHQIEMLIPAALRDSEDNQSDISPTTCSTDGIRTNQELVGVRKD